jgi:raffinose/stachyose/melibiose transport system substrate-binding protein
MSNRIRAIGVGVLVVAALVVAGVVWLASDDSSDEPAVLKLWHYEAPDSAMGIAWKQAIADFERTHPEVDVRFEQKAFEQIRQTANLVLNSPNAPDLMEFNKGNASAGLLAKQGLLTDLTDAVEEYGWDEKLSPSLQTTSRYDTNGIMGGGEWYGVPNYGEYVMVYYNKDMFAEHSVEVPKTLQEFEVAMDTFMKAGVTPLSVAGAEYPAQQIWYQLVLSKVDRDWVNAYELYQGDVDFQAPELVEATNQFLSWVEKGYIGKDSAGIKAEDMGVAFENGKYPMMISGSWWYGGFVTNIKNFEWGIFLFPGNKLHPGSGGNIWVIPKNAKNADLAEEFIDLTMSAKIQNLLGNSGGVPVAAETAEIKGEKNAELIENFNTVVETDGLAFYPDWPAPGYYDTLVANVQNLINGKTDAEGFLSAIQKPYDQYVDSVSG